VTLVTQYDIELLLNIESHINTKLETLEFNEKEVLENMIDVTKAKKIVKIVIHKEIYLKCIENA